MWMFVSESDCTREREFGRGVKGGGKSNMILIT